MSDIVKYEPRRPVGSAGAFRGLLQAFEPSFQGVLPRHRDVQRLIKLALVAATKTPKLLQCTQESLIQSVMTAAELGMDISGTMGEAYILPYGQAATFQLGYKGMVKLARQSGEIARIEADTVYENDHFVYKKGLNPVLDHEPITSGDRGRPIGAYALIQYSSGGVETDYMGLPEIEKVRRVSKAGNSGPWKDWWDEMAKKTVLRRLLKMATLSTEKMQIAFEVDNAGHDLGQTTGEVVESQDLNAALGLSPEPDATIDEDE